MDEYVVKKLSELYDRRRRLLEVIRTTERPSNVSGDSFWEGFFEKCGHGTGTHSSIIGAVGTRAEVSSLMGIAWKSAVESRIACIESEIEELGGVVK